MPSLDLHDSLSVELLKRLGVKPDPALVRLANRLIDAKMEEKGEFLDEVRRLVGEFKLYECKALPIGVTEHDMGIVRCSERRRSQVGLWRGVFNCLFGEPYGLIVDLHMLLDLADRFCCDRELLELCYERTELNERVWDFYKARERELQLKLGCPERVRECKCARARVARELWGLPIPEHYMCTSIREERLEDVGAEMIAAKPGTLENRNLKVLVEMLARELGLDASRLYRLAKLYYLDKPTSIIRRRIVRRLLSRKRFKP